MNYSPLILIIDDEVAILQTLKESLQDEGFRAQVLSDGNKALSLIGELVPDLVFLDIFMPNCNGLELLGKIKKEYPSQKVIIISGFGNIPLAIDAIKQGAIDFIEKPFNLDDIFSKISFLQDTQTHGGKISVKQNDADLARAVEADIVKKLGIVGESFLFQELITQIKNVARLKYPLLIYGEHGTGKTLLSEFVHNFCYPKIDLGSKPFTVIDCLASSIDSISFDLEGTILIKNIDALSFDSQKKLLSYFDSEQYKSKNIDGRIKIIATSSKSLFALMRADKFNKLLFYKLNITPVEVPSINRRRYDIPLLIDHLLEKFNRANNKNVTLDVESIRYLRNRYWVGNITQIKDLLEKIVVLAKSSDLVITMRDLEAMLSEREVEFVEEQSFLSFKSFEEAKQSFEKKYLLYVLRKSNFDLQQTSEKLNISLTSLSDKVSKLDLNLKSVNLD